ncbi:MAG: polysaccharide deacetylase family protein, partial [Nannocystaceae bacterium]|nr:polysaccharide deacetylase family protein [Nannocystaceae bacterium]
RVAVTVDDLPSHGPLPPDTTRLQLHQSLLAALLAHEVPRVYGFANLGSAAQDGATDPSLRAWIAAGFPLGNHTWSHPHLREIGVPAYLAEIDRNDVALGSLVADENTRRVFRYPFLMEGTDPQSTRAIRQHLSASGYRIAEVTIDFYDWAFNAPYVRCLALRDEAAIAALRETFVRHAVRMLQWSDEAAIRVWGRRIPHVLLLHVGAFDAVMIEALLDAYEEAGVEWITLDEALEDPVYDDLPTAPGQTRGTLIDMMVDARDADHPPWPEHPAALLRVLCAGAGDVGSTEP